MRAASVFHQTRLYFMLSAIGMVLATAVYAPATALQFDDSHIQQVARARYGQGGATAVSRWLAMMAQQRSAPESQQLRAVNDFWNSTVRGSEDRYVWNQADYWATPLETLGKQAGDCEDFVIGKYFSLIHMGVPAERLRLVYVKARIGGMGSSTTIAHMVLGYYATPDADPLVLDSLLGSIAPASQRRDLTPVFSFNAQGIYVAGAAPTSPDRIGHWRNLLSKMQKEGFQP